MNLIKRLNQGYSSSNNVEYSLDQGFGSTKIYSNINIINTSNSSQTFSINLWTGSVGGSGATSQRLYHNYLIPANSSIKLEPGVVLSGNQGLSIVAQAGMAWSIYGVQL